MLDVIDIAKSYAKRGAAPSGGVRDVTLSVQKGAFFTLLGPSGCGKTTTLRCIAGLEMPDRGRIAIGGETVFDDAAGVAVPVNRRGIGMVFQSYAIWPHMSVAENAGFPLRVQRPRLGRAEIDANVRRALETVGLGGYEMRSATRLSGGQQQRLALARAIIHEPSLLLLDEPLSNLDARLREEMRTELKRLQREVGLTAIYVTHDQGEALSMSDSIAVLDQGHVVQCGTPDDIYARPANRFVAGFVGAANLLDGTLLGDGQAYGRQAVRLRGGAVIEAVGRVATGAVCVCVRPEAIRVRAAGQGGAEDNVLTGRITGLSFLGNTTMLQVRVERETLQVLAHADDCRVPGAEVSVRFAAADAIVLPE